MGPYLHFRKASKTRFVYLFLLTLLLAQAPSFPVQAALQVSDQAFPRSSGLSRSCAQLDHSDWKLGASHIETSLKLSPQVLRHGNSSKCAQ